ncbi:MAG: NAD-dependent epimerase/dehydratase family protein [Candidatus Aureabacteria bacterium]|nr:NAD-dependent epimerase/dehydratase family protein [Candidatus Auribacterota bacterium]
MNILVTGATGFIGRHLVEELATSSEDIIYCIVRNTKKSKLIEKFGVNLIYADITDEKSLLKSLPEKIDVIYHCAGYVSNKNRENLHKVNVLSTKYLCQFALINNVKRFIHVSSIAPVLGNADILLTEDLPYNPTNPYGESKAEAEKIVIDYRKKGLKVSVIRPCMVYGEGEPHALNKLLTLLKYRLFPLVDHGKNKFHLVYVKNVVDALIFSARSEKCLEGTFYIADKEILTSKEVFSTMSQALNARNPFELPSFLTSFLFCLPYFGSKLKKVYKDRIYSTSSLQSAGFTFRYPAKESIIRTCKHFLNKTEKV